MNSKSVSNLREPSMIWSNVIGENTYAILPMKSNLMTFGKWYNFGCWAVDLRKCPHPKSQIDYIRPHTD